MKSNESDRGTVESAMVLIPTLLLFLAVVQISVAVLAHSAGTNSIQGQVSRVALLHSVQSSEGLAIERTPLPGGGSIISGRGEKSIPIISPILIGRSDLTLSGIAVDENHN